MGNVHGFASLQTGNQLRATRRASGIRFKPSVPTRPRRQSKKEAPMSTSSDETFQSPCRGLRILPGLRRNVRRDEISCSEAAHNEARTRRSPRISLEER